MLFLKRPHAHAHDEPDHDDHGGLHRDLGATMDRRGMLRLAARFGVVLGAAQLAACAADGIADVGSTDMGTGSGSGGGNGTGTSGAACAAKIPEETAGPYPGDGSNGPNVLTQSGVVRQDIRTSFAGLSGTATGVLLDLELTIVSASTCSPLAGYAVYLWHCDRAGNYSLYSSGATSQNWLRGVQAADANGKVRFTTSFPGCYAGRWPHIHFEVYESLTAATAVRNKIATSQIALPKTACDAVYATSSYSSSVSNFSRITLASDNVFSDGASLELATVTGDVTSGMTATLTVGI
jgi:protocatechuate 3,4-dioxygenase beta subunit